MQNWNSQPVFSRDPPLERQEKQFDRLKLAAALDIWSLGNQADLAPAIAKLPMPITWVVGEHDAHYRLLAKSLNFTHPKSRIVIIPNGGHRLLFHPKIDTLLILG